MMFDSIVVNFLNMKSSKNGESIKKGKENDYSWYQENDEQYKLYNTKPTYYYNTADLVSLIHIYI